MITSISQEKLYKRDAIIGFAEAGGCASKWTLDRSD